MFHFPSPQLSDVSARTRAKSENFLERITKRLQPLLSPHEIRTDISVPAPAQSEKTTPQLRDLTPVSLYTYILSLFFISLTVRKGVSILELWSSRDMTT